VIAECNTGRTLDGIDTGGKRLAEVIISTMENEERKITTSNVSPDNAIYFLLSCVGHSLGGLYCRNAIKHLYENKPVWCKIIPVNITCLSSPHLGVRRPSSWFNTAIDYVARWWYKGNTLQELLIEDGDPRDPDVTKRPLLYRMTVPEGSYMQALMCFKYRTLFTVVQRDFQVPYCSSSMLPMNSYQRPLQSATVTVLGHSGFSVSDYEHIFSKELESLFHVHHHPDNKKEEQEDFEKLHTMIDDNYSELTYLPAMMKNMNTLAWRRVDMDFNGTNFAHDLMVKKASIPYLINTEPGEMVVLKLTEIVLLDHSITRKEAERKS